ncbi:MULTISPECIES: excalibur calcium-binding domain-containing protein [Lysinibacillus]|uniref:excalibur calcium-binding domain-containing protein n=1 Tax=Lysinibacillus TaxID=400634 RepID=UPI0025939866|nr:MULTISPECIES: excalibur calcium-binding domain-containing protein [Lysinibacillus]MEC1303501.1 excalibur calcium-binding domain-containing protein [Lysinibacillus capsici]
MNGCLLLILAIIALVVVIKYPLFIIGVVLILWGLREYKINKHLKAKSKVIPAIIIFGCILSLSGCVLTINGAQEEERQAELKKQEELKNQQELERKKEQEKQEELERQKELERQAELKRQEELERQAELERQEEAKKQEELKQQQEAEAAVQQSNSQQQNTPQKEYYRNCTELRKVYPNGVGSDHPAYASKHDRDNDNWACER